MGREQTRTSQWVWQCGTADRQNLCWGDTHCTGWWLVARVGFARATTASRRTARTVTLKPLRSDFEATAQWLQSHFAVALKSLCSAAGTSTTGQWRQHCCPAASGPHPTKTAPVSSSFRPATRRAAAHQVCQSSTEAGVLCVVCEAKKVNTKACRPLGKLETLKGGRHPPSFCCCPSS